MGQPTRAAAPLVGIIANPVSARDIRRVIANANSLQLADRVNIVLRLLAALAACGVGRVLMMPDREGLRVMLARHLSRRHGPDAALPAVDYLDMPVTASVDDTLLAARRMAEAGVAAIIVLGGDGTHRAVVRECGAVPIAGLSTGTNNAFPEMREPTVTGLAAGLFASGRVPAARALLWNKRLDIAIRDGDGGLRRDIALVDAVISHEHFIGARALWTRHAGRDLCRLCRSGGDRPVVHRRPAAAHRPPRGKRVNDRARHARRLRLRAAGADRARPAVPGAGRGLAPAEHGHPAPVRQRSGIVALDGERELAFGAHDEVTITLHEQAFRSLDVSACMRYAADAGLMRGTVQA